MLNICNSGSHYQMGMQMVTIRLKKGHLISKLLFLHYQIPQIYSFILNIYRFLLKVFHRQFYNSEFWKQFQSIPIKISINYSMYQLSLFGIYLNSFRFLQSHVIYWSIRYSFIKLLLTLLQNYDYWLDNSIQSPRLMYLLSNFIVFYQIIKLTFHLWNFLISIEYLLLSKGLH